MANLEKMTHSAVRNLLRHHDREIINNSNKDIIAAKSNQNYDLVERDIHPYNYYLKRKSEMRCMNRKDVKTVCEWVVTAPQTVPVEYHQEFFERTVEFLHGRYGVDNCLKATVHMDEATPHLHYTFIPAVPDVKHGGLKICANELITRSELRNFHPQFQNFINEQGIPGAKVHTGITAAQGGNRTVKEMKAERVRDQKFTWKNYNQAKTREEREW